MAKQQIINGITKPCLSTAAILARRVVCEDASNRGNAKLPTATTEVPIGVSLEPQSAANNVAVQTEGIAIIESDGSAVINPGDFVIPVVTTGRVKSQAIAAGSANAYQVVGRCIDDHQIAATAGLYVSVQLTLGPPAIAA